VNLDRGAGVTLPPVVLVSLPLSVLEPPSRPVVRWRAPLTGEGVFTRAFGWSSEDDKTTALSCVVGKPTISC